MKKPTHYIDNIKFYENMTDWIKGVREAQNADEKNPPITNYIGECFMSIAENLSKKGNFIKYPFRDDMISDAIENCVMYAHNFDPDKSKNPFSYFTQITYFAFLRRIEKEKKQMYIKYKLMEQHPDSTLSWYKENYFEKKKEENIDDALKKEFELTDKDIEKFGSSSKKKGKK
jgi:hypothetical protein